SPSIASYALHRPLHSFPTRRSSDLAAQVGSVDRTAQRSDTLARMIKLLDEAIAQNVQLVVYPETTFTTFFPRHLITDQGELDTRSEEHTSELQSRFDLVCRLLLEKK